MATSFVNYNSVGSAIRARLIASTALISTLGGTKIYRTMAPQGTVTPYAIYAFVHGGVDNLYRGDSDIEVWLVKGVSGDETSAWLIDYYIQTQLHYGTVTVPGWTCYDLQRENVWSVREVAGGSVAYHCGAYYRVFLTAST